MQLDDGSLVEGGRVLMRDQWNSAMYATLEEKHKRQDMYQDSQEPLCLDFGGGTASEELLSARGIRTLLFAGANTDQGVGGSLQDAFTKGWDCLLLSDGCATTSPDFARQCIEFNTNEGLGVLCYPVKAWRKVLMACKGSLAQEYEGIFTTTSRHQCMDLNSFVRHFNS